MIPDSQADEDFKSMVAASDVALVLSRPHKRHGRDQRAATRGTFTPTKPAAATKVGELPDKVDAYLATCNRKQRRAFVADAKRSHRKAGKELQQAQGKLSRLVGPGAVRP